jgi:hypothetical protein
MLRLSHFLSEVREPVFEVGEGLILTFNDDKVSDRAV